MKFRIYLFITFFIFQLNNFLVQSTSIHPHSIIQHIRDIFRLKSKTNDISSTILDNPPNASSSIKKFGVIDDLMDRVESFAGKIISLPHQVSEKVEHDWEKVKETPKAAREIVSSIGETAETQVKNAGNTIKSKVSENASKFFKALKDAENKVSGEVTEAKEKTKNLVIFQVSNFVTSEIERFTSLPKMTQERLVQLYQNKKNNIFNKTNEMSNNVKNLAWDGTASILSFVKEVIFQASVLGVLFALKVIFEVHIVIHLKPIHLTVGDVISSYLKRKRKGSNENMSPGNIKLNSEDFIMRCVSVRAEKIPKDDNYYLVKLFVHYEISYFQTTEGEVFLKFIVVSSDIAEEAAVLKIPAEKFVEKCITEGCLLANPVNKSTKSIDVRVRVGFKSDSGQYIALHSSDFKVALT